MTNSPRFIFGLAASAVLLAAMPSAMAAPKSSASKSAAPKSSAPTRTSSTRDTRSSAQNAPPATYEGLRRSLKIDANLTIETVQSDPETYGGRVVEFAGNVTGVMKKNGVRNIYISSENSLVTFALPADFRDAAVLSAGNRVRVLALVGRVSSINSAANASQIVPISPLAAQIAPQFFSAEAMQAAPALSENATIALDQLPPATELPIMPGTRRVSSPSRSTSATSSTRTSSTRTNGNAAKRSTITISEGDNALDAQLPAYRAMIRRHNSRLRPDQVDAIGIALMQAGAENKMDPRFLAAVIAVESDFDIYCRSSSGAMGLGQIMPFNMKEARITNAWDPVQNVFGTARLLRGHLNDFAGRPNATLLAVAGYNAGPNAVKRAGYVVPKGAQVQRYVWKVYYRYKAFAPDMF